VDAFERVGADDDVGDGGAVLEDEDGVLAASVLVGIAWLATVEFLVAEVLAAGDAGRRGERDDGASSSWDVECLCRGKSSNEGRDLDLSELHLDFERSKLLKRGFDNNVEE
jgi:hypothetical protein